MQIFGLYGFAKSDLYEMAFSNFAMCNFCDRVDFMLYLCRQGVSVNSTVIVEFFPKFLTFLYTLFRTFSGTKFVKDGNFTLIFGCGKLYAALKTALEQIRFELKKCHKWLI